MTPGRSTATGAGLPTAPFRVEPAYEIRKPFQEQPIIKVGVILAEDRISKNTIKIPCRTKMSASDGKEVTLTSGSEVVLQAIGTHLDVSCGDRGEAIRSSGRITISPLDNSPLKPKSGYFVEQVVAGRYFHWRKTIGQFLPGALEVSAVNGCIRLINILKFEEYLACVVTSEMSSECPIDLIKAQVTAARSWSACFMEKHQSEGYNVCNDDECQRYQGTTFLKAHIIKAVQDTSGEFLVFINEHGEQQIEPAFYSKSCGGFSELSRVAFDLEANEIVSIFDGESSKEQKLDLSDEKQFEAFLETDPNSLRHIYCNIPKDELAKYLGGVDEVGEYFRWEYQASNTLLINNLKNKYGIGGVSKIIDLKPVSNKPGVPIRGPGGRFHAFSVRCVLVSGEEREIIVPNQYDIRALFHESFLFSSAFCYKVHRGSDNSVVSVTFKGLGWGHGCGYCSIGAISMALKGKSYREILKHYFPNTELLKTY